MVTYKPFLVYQDQIALLKKKGLLITNDAHAIQFLKQYSYFDLITGYKKPFKQKNGQYKLHTRIEDIVRLYTFDESLRALFLQYILKVEKHIKSLLSYVFCVQYGTNEQRFLSPTNYISQHIKQDIQRLITELKRVQSSSKYHYIKHHREKYNNVPLWVAIKAVSFGTVSKMYTFLPQPLKIEISKEFSCIHENMLQEMLSLLSRVRNICAHSERLFDYRDRQSIPDTDIHHILQIAQSKGRYKKGKKDLFAVLIVLKYLLNPNDFSVLMHQLQVLITSVCHDIYNIQLTQMHQNLGLPQNWEDLISCPKQQKTM